MKIYHEDCMVSMKSLPDQSIDAVITDLPYGITRCKWDSVIPLDALWQEYLRVGKPNCPFVLFGSQPFTSALIMSNPSIFRYCWYWEKEKGTGFLNVTKQPLRCIEEICIFYRKPPTYNPQMVLRDRPVVKNLAVSNTENTGVVASCSDGKGASKSHTHRYPKNHLCYSRDGGNRGLHSTQKPLALLEYLVLTYTSPGDTVLDNAMGSGTAGVACKKLGREFIGMEIEKRYFLIAQNRISNAMVASVLSTGEPDTIPPLP
jgi:site-specific DNA-methyltransferase (adenine-specific)